MKALAWLAIVAMVLAGCTQPSDANDPQDMSDDPLPTGQEAINLIVDVPDAPIADYTWTLTGTVDQEAEIRVYPIGVIFGEREPDLVANGPWSWQMENLDAWKIGHQVWGVSASSTYSHASVEFTLNVLADATVRIDFGETSDHEPINDTVWVDVTSYAAQAQYDERGVKHPEYVNIHDALTTWEQQTGHVIDYSYNEDFGSFGVDRVNGEGNSLEVGEPPWWCYEINGEHRGVQGITPQRFQPGDDIHWVLGTCEEGLTP